MTISAIIELGTIFIAIISFIISKIIVNRKRQLRELKEDTKDCSYKILQDFFKFGDHSKSDSFIKSYIDILIAAEKINFSLNFKSSKVEYWFTKDQLDFLNTNPESIVNIKLEKFSNINLDDPFFNSFRENYENFDEWFKKKEDNSESAYYTTSIDNKVTSFLYLKVEDASVEDYSNFDNGFKDLVGQKCLKIESLKVYSNNCHLGKIYFKKIFQKAKEYDVDSIYTTLFPKHTKLINSLNREGFKFFGHKGLEYIYIKHMKTKNLEKEKERRKKEIGDEIWKYKQKIESLRKEIDKIKNEGNEIPED